MSNIGSLYRTAQRLPTSSPSLSSSTDSTSLLVIPQPTVQCTHPVEREREREREEESTVLESLYFRVSSYASFFLSTTLRLETWRGSLSSGISLHLLCWLLMLLLLLFFRLPLIFPPHSLLLCFWRLKTFSGISFSELYDDK